LSAQRDGDAVTLRFGGITGKLVAYNTDHPTGFELCGAQPGTCHYALADMHGDRITLHVPAADAATRVRYCWGDSPICTLYDQAGLPAGPFDIHVTPASQH
jgi:sialate O-acetylesterase